MESAAVKSELSAVLWYLSKLGDDISAEGLILIRGESDLKFVTYVAE